MKNWERSFPEAQLTDHSWMIDVLEDLANYCEYNKLSLEEFQVRQTLDQIIRYQSGRILDNDLKISKRLRLV